MKIFLLIFLFISCGIVPKHSRRTNVYALKPYINSRVKHYNCIKDYIKLDVEPNAANTICIDIFRKRF